LVKELRSDDNVRFAKWVFLVAGIYGVALLGPMFFLEDRLGRDNPPAITHPEFFYGFVGAAFAWQIMYLLIGLDPARYRTIMLVGAAAKIGFFVTCVILYAMERLAASTVAIATPDAVLGVFFVAAWLRTPRDWPNLAA
jgi:hypothetical protein